MVQFEIDIIFAHDRLQPRTYQSAAQNGSFLRCCPEFRTVLEFPPTSDVLATQFAPAAMNSKTHDALLCLARNPDDCDAMIIVYQENRDAIRAAFRRWIGGRKYRNVLELGMMVQVCKMAYLFDPKKHRAEAWVFERANAYCWNFRTKLENESAWKN